MEPGSVMPVSFVIINTRYNLPPNSFADCIPK